MKQKLLDEKERLESELKKVTAELSKIYTAESISKLKNNSIIKKYSFIIFSEEEGELRIGLSSFNKGYIDDHIPEDREIVFELLSILPLEYETNSCTYSINEDSLEEIKSIISQLGLKEVDPAWL